jgi:ubiquinone/menaquinone biosynthesis C-methylase UbiE
MGPLRGVIDAADATGRRNEYMHALHLRVLRNELRASGSLKSALDFGCGTGRFIKTLTAHCDRVCATDKEPAMLEAARTYAGGCDVEIAPCEAANVPFDNAQFDFVLCSSVLCVTLPDMVEDIVKELARVTKAGGRLLLLEQVSDERGLPVVRYYNALRRAGFELIRGYPIRSANSRITSVVTRTTLIPGSIFDALASMEVLITRLYGRRTQPRYIEYAIVARKR